jgi:hypothetical protein
MATAVVDLPGLLKGIPSGAWVAISERMNSVLSYGPDAQEVLRKAKEQHEDLPLIVRVPDQRSSMFF